MQMRAKPCNPFPTRKPRHTSLLSKHMIRQPRFEFFIPAFFNHIRLIRVHVMEKLPLATEPFDFDTFGARRPGRNEREARSVKDSSRQPLSLFSTFVQQPARSRRNQRFPSSASWQLQFSVRSAACRAVISRGLGLLLFRRGRLSLNRLRGLLFFMIDLLRSFPLESRFSLGVFFSSRMTVCDGQLIMACRVRRLEFHGSL